MVGLKKHQILYMTNIITKNKLAVNSNFYIIYILVFILRMVTK